MQRAPRLTRSTTADGEVLVVAVDGGIDIASSRHVADVVLTEAQRTIRAVVVDLTAVDYLDSSGIHLLIRLQHRLGSRRQALHAVVDPESVVREVLDVTAVAKLVPVHADVDAALAAARAPEGAA